MGLGLLGQEWLVRLVNPTTWDAGLQTTLGNGWAVSIQFLL